MEAPTVITEHHGEVVVVALQGEHDMATAPQVREALAAIGNRDGVVIDLADTSFMDSSILGVLVGGVRRAREDGRGFVFVLAEDSPSVVSRLFEVTGLRNLFPVYASRDTAVEAASRGMNAPVASAG